MREKLAGGAPVGSVQLNRNEDVPSLSRAKATPSVTEYLLVLTSELTACDMFASRRKPDAIPY